MVIDKLLNILKLLLFNKKLDELIKENEQLKEKLLRANKLLTFCVVESNKKTWGSREGV